MKLGAYTFFWDPANFDPLVPEKMISSVKTYEGAAVFSWGASIIGKEVTLKWDLMEQAQFESIQAIYEADDAVLWDLDIPGHINYNVAVKSFNGEHIDVVYDNPHRVNVELVLLILEESSVGTS